MEINNAENLAGEHIKENGIVKTTFAVFKKNFCSMLQISFLFGIIYVGALIFSAMPLIAIDFDADIFYGAMSWGYLFLMICYPLITIYFQYAITSSNLQYILKGKSTLAESFKQPAAKLTAILWTSFLCFLLSLILLMITRLLLEFCVTFGLLRIFAMIFLTLIYIGIGNILNDMTKVVVLLEGKRGLGAIKRSFELAHGDWKRIIAYLLTILLLFFAISIIIFGVIFILIAAIEFFPVLYEPDISSQTSAILSLMLRWLQYVVLAILVFFPCTIGGITFTCVAYFDLKSRREASDDNNSSNIDGNIGENELPTI